MLASNGLRLPPCGVPIVVSSYLSPTTTPLTKNFLINDITLNELDKELEARGLSFVRYADDL